MGYTSKQWGVHPSELPASILKRLLIHFNYNDNYYNDWYQGILENGYTHIIKKLSDHQNIYITLNSTFFQKRFLIMHILSIVGRLGTYRYIDMDKSIEDTIEIALSFIKLNKRAVQIPTFFQDPL